MRKRGAAGEYTGGMKTWRDFSGSLAGAPASSAPPFRAAAHLAASRSGGGGSSSSSFFSEDPLGADRLEFLPTRLRFGSSSWPLPSAPPLRDAALALHLGDLYARPLEVAHGASRPRTAAGDASSSAAAGTDAVARGVAELHGAVRAWLLEERGASSERRSEAASSLARCSERATPEDWLQALQHMTTTGDRQLGSSRAGASCGSDRRPLLGCMDASASDVLCGLMSVCHGLGDCVLGHALPSILAASVGPADAAPCSPGDVQTRVASDDQLHALSQLLTQVCGPL